MQLNRFNELTEPFLRQLWLTVDQITNQYNKAIPKIKPYVLQIRIFILNSWLQRFKTAMGFRPFFESMFLLLTLPQTSNMCNVLRGLSTFKTQRNIRNSADFHKVCLDICNTHLKRKEFIVNVICESINIKIDMMFPINLFSHQEQQIKFGTEIKHKDLNTKISSILNDRNRNAYSWQSNTYQWRGTDIGYVLNSADKFGNLVKWLQKTKSALIYNSEPTKRMKAWAALLFHVESVESSLMAKIKQYYIFADLYCLKYMSGIIYYIILKLKYDTFFFF